MTSRDAAPAAVSAGPLTAAAAAKPRPALLDVNRLRPGRLRCAVGSSATGRALGGRDASLVNRLISLSAQPRHIDGIDGLQTGPGC